MDESGTTPQVHTRKHLLPPGEVPQAAEGSIEIDLTRHHGQSNGLRVHGVYFAVISLVVLVALLAAIAVASDMM